MHWYQLLDVFFFMLSLFGAVYLLIKAGRYDFALDYNSLLA